MQQDTSRKLRQLDQWIAIAERRGSTESLKVYQDWKDELTGANKRDLYSQIQHMADHHLDALRAVMLGHFSAHRAPLFHEMYGGKATTTILDAPDEDFLSLDFSALEKRVFLQARQVGKSEMQRRSFRQLFDEVPQIQKEEDETLHPRVKQKIKLGDNSHRITKVQR